MSDLDLEGEDYLTPPGLEIYKLHHGARFILKGAVYPRYDVGWLRGVVDRTRS